MATSPRTVGHGRQRQRPDAFQRGYATSRFKRRRRAFLERIVRETGDLICGICGKTMLNAKPREITIDHIEPALRFGPYGSSAYERAFYDEGNWRPAHLSCNARRGKGER